MNPEARPSRELSPVNLSVRQPDGDKGYMITYRGSTKDECMAYNIAIQEVLRAEGLPFFHQIGDGIKPGEHGWEIMLVQEKVDNVRLQTLIPKIDAIAEIYLSKEN